MNEERAAPGPPGTARPTSVIGRRTDDALRSGIVFGAIDAIDGIVRRIKAEWQRPEAFVVATGGLAPLIGPLCSTVDHVEPFLTLYGLERAYRFLSASQTRRTR